MDNSSLWFLNTEATSCSPSGTPTNVSLRPVELATATSTSGISPKSSSRENPPCSFDISALLTTTKCQTELTQTTLSRAFSGVTMASDCWQVHTTTLQESGVCKASWRVYSGLKALSFTRAGTRLTLSLPLEVMKPECWYGAHQAFRKKLCITSSRLEWS